MRCGGSSSIASTTPSRSSWSSVVGFYNMVVRVLDAVELDVEPEYAELVSLMPDRGVRSDV